MSAVLAPEENPIAAYDSFRAQLAELKEANDKAVFDYEDDKGNKEARSHVFKLRKTKTAIDKSRKAEKETSLAYGRRVDAEAKEITAEIEAMIEVHDSPLKAIEKKEKDRKAAIEAKYDEIVEYKSIQCKSSDELNSLIAQLENLMPDASFDELMGEATREHGKAKSHLGELLTIALQAEEDQAELDRLRQEQVERDQKEREDRIAREAAETATRLAEEKAANDIAKAEKETQDAKDREQQAQREKDDLELKAIQDRKDAENLIEQNRLDEIQRQENIIAAEKAEQDKREANKRHVGNVRKEAKEAIMKILDFSEADAKAIVLGINAGDIPHISIKY